MQKLRIILIAVIFWMGSATALQAQQLLLQEGMQKYQQGDFKKSIELLEQAIQQNSLQLNAHVLLGASYLKQEVPEMAQLKAEQGLQHFPNAGALKWIQAEAFFQQRLFQKALPLYNTLYADSKVKGSLDPLQIDQRQIKKRMIQANKILASEAFQRNELDEAKKYINRIHSLNPDDFEARKNLVYLYLKNKEWKKALKTVNKALEDEPENRDLLRMKASALYNLKDFEGLKREYKILYKQDPDNIETALTYAEILVGSQKSSEAVKIYERLLEKYPDDRRIYEALIEVNERRLNLQGKRAVLRRMEGQFPGDKKVSTDIAATFEQEDKWGEARAVYDSLLVTGGDSLALQKKIAKTFVAQDSLQEAEKLYNQLYNHNNTDKDLVLRYGNVLEQASKWGAARTLYEEYLTIQKDGDIYHRMGIVLVALEKDQAAIESFREALAMGNRNPDLYLRLSQLLAIKGPEKMEEARSKSKKALTLSLEKLKESQNEVEQRISQNSLANQLKNQEQFKELEELNELAKDAFTHYTKINLSDEIQMMFDKIESTYPGSGRLLYLIGDYYQKRQQSKKAKLYFQEAIRYTPKLREAHIGLARLFERSGKHTSAISSYERALSLDPKQPEPYDALIRLYRKQGELNTLCDRWKARYRANIDNEILKEFLIEALHKSKRYDEAKKLIKEG